MHLLVTLALAEAGIFFGTALNKRKKQPVAYEKES